jgi:hypothetical protein
VAKLLLVRPSYDHTTSALHSWADEVLTEIQSSHTHAYRELSGPAAVRTNVEAELQQSTDCFVFYGHGAPDYLESHGGVSTNPAVLDTTNSDLLNRMIVYAVACDSARDLGPDAVNQGSTIYIGYRRSFRFITGTGREDWFKHAANAVILYLLTPSSDPSCGAAVAYARKEYDRAYAHFKQGGGARDPNRVLAFSYLRWDRDSLVMIGNRKASLL